MLALEAYETIGDSETIAEIHWELAQQYRKVRNEGFYDAYSKHASASLDLFIKASRVG